MKYYRFRRLVAWLIMATMTMTQTAQVAAITLAQGPLAASTTTTVRPNIMYVLDDSGSMAWDYTPDYINDSTTAADPGSVGGSIGDGAFATVTAGSVSAIIPANGTWDTAYTLGAPVVVIQGGGGTGAAATVALNATTKKVSAVTVTNGGSGYGSIVATTTATGTSGTKVITVGSPANFLVGYAVSGTGIGINAFILSVAGNTVTLSVNNSGAVSGTVTVRAAPYVSLVGGLASASWGMCWGTTGASNAGGVPKDTIVAPTCTTNSQPPYAASAINYQFYDPAIRYEVPRKAAWNTSCVAGDTTCFYPNATPTAALTNGFSGAGTKNLTSAWTHEVWCNTASPSPAPTAANIATHAQCRENLDTSNDALYPNVTYTFKKTYTGPAAYFTMSPAEFCTDDRYTNCVRSTTPQVIGGITFNVPSNYRWCSYYNPQTHTYGNCQGRRDLSHYIPNYLGGWITSGAAGVQATASMQITSAASGQSLTAVNVGSIDVLGGTAINATGTDTAVVAADVCAAIRANAAATGFSCAQVGNTVLIQAAAVGTAANGLPVVAAGPAAALAANSKGELRVLSADAGYSLSSITITRADTSTTNLLANSVTAGTTTGNTAQAICQAINANPANTGVYQAKSGNPADGTLNYGTCLSTVDAWVGIQRMIADTTDNGASITVAGPAVGVTNSGTIIVNSTGGATTIGNITLAGASILSSTPLNYTDGLLINTIAADIATKISAAGCTANSNANTVTISGTCSGALAVTGAGSPSTGVFRVASTGSTNAADLAGIRVGGASGTSIVGHVTAAQITNGSAVSANASTLAGLVNAGTGTHGFAASAALAASPAPTGTYDVTVSYAAGNTYNGQSFWFGNGTASGGSAGSAPSWNFRITGATADSALMPSISCGATNITSGTGNTGAGTSVDYLKNLTATGAAALNARNWTHPTSGVAWSYACTTPTVLTPSSHCTVTGTGGSNICGDSTFTVTKDASITMTTPTRTQTAGGTAPQWTFDVTGATADNAAISAITCGADSVTDTSANTGASSTYAARLAADIENKAEDGVGDWSSSASAHTCTATSASALSCKLCQSSGNRCSAHTATITNPSGGLTINQTAETFENISGTNRYCYNFTVTGANATNETVRVVCDSDTAVDAGTTGSTAVPASPEVSRINTLVKNNGSNDLESADANGYSISCTAPASVPAGSTCTVTGPVGAAKCSSFSFTKDASITIANQSQVSAGGTTPGIWEFDVTGATSASKTISHLYCEGLRTFDESTLPSTGTSTGGTVEGRINSLRSTLIGANGYTLSCPVAATATSQFTDCSVTGPVPTVVPVCTGFTFPGKAASIGVGTVTQTSAGSVSTATADDYMAAPALTQVSAFTAGQALQSTTPTGMASTSTGTIPTSTVAMSNGSPPSVLTILTNATGTAPNVLTMGGGADPDTGTNRWNDVGILKRVDVVATDNSYNRASGRTDCVGSTCTYTEEMQNFANWYSYYSTRMQMMKSATTIAFSPLDDKFRVGYDNICGADTGTETTVVRGVGQFVDGGEIANQRTNWWSNLVSTSPNCATPLRSTAAKIGRYYAGKLTGSADPMQYSCQQNFIMMVTDGYWNENETSAIKGVTGADIGNQDNVLANAPRPYFDGQQASTTCPAVGGGRGNNASSCRTLGDIAWYYYSTDLRSSAFGNATNAGGLDVATNNVLVSPDDPNTAQHMVFYAMGLGIDGILEYRSDYQTAGVGDFAEIRAGSRNWPAVANLAPTGVDDLWHATVNGHGKYFSARNVPNVVAGLKEALNKIGARVGSASASATSNLRPVTGDNFAYVANYTTVDWTGDLQSRTIDLTNAAVSEDGTHCGVDMANCQWSAQARIDQMTWSARRLFVKPLSNVSGDPLRPFTYTDLTATERNLLDPGVAPAISQYAALHVSNPGDINTSNLVDYLRGNRGLEQDGDVSHPQIWRKRVHVLGDIVNTSPIFVKSPDLKYVDAGYDQFKTTSAAASRKPVVFISAQDGMIHTINADTSPVTVASATVQPGEEMWSYIPQQSLAQMKTLADQNYTHRFFIDGPTVVSDANFGNGVSDWHTILVAGLGAGGTSYVALDVTDPVAPVYLWEFTDSRLGSSLGNPEIKKLPNGEWAVLFTSGYNNADGNGYLFAVDPATGSVKSGFPLATGSGTAGSPSNLGKLTVWMNNPNQDATAQYVYAGDTKGGVWRFDLNPSAAGHTGVAVYKLAHLTHSGVDQPITTRIEVTEQCGTPKIRLVYVSTGQYLATADLTNTDVQAFYAIKDRLVSTASPPAAERNLDSSTAGGTTPTFEKRVLHSVYSDGTPITTTVNGATKSGRIVCRAGASVSRLAGACVDDSAAKLDWTTSPGFFFNFPESGERTSIDPELIEGTVVINSNIPGASSCTIGGVSRNTQVSACAGLDPGPEPEPIPPCTGPGCTNDGGVLIDPTRHDNPAKINANLDCIVVGNALVQLPDGSWWNIQTCSDGTHRNVAKDVQPRSVFDSKRSLWREYEPF